MWRRAGRKDYKDALYRLGLLYVTRAQDKLERLGGATSAHDGAAVQADAGSQDAAALAAAEQAEGEKNLRKAAHAGHMNAKFVLGALLLGGLVEEAHMRKKGGSGIVTVDERAAAQQEEGVKLLRQAATGGELRAQAAMGRLLLDGLHGVKRDVVEAATWVGLAAEGGDGPSQLLYGCMYIDGFLRKVTKPVKEGRTVKAHAGAVVQERDPALGVQWVRKAAEGGVPDAQFKLACHLFDPGANDETVRGGASAADNEQALGWVRRAADAGHAEAAWLLARRLAITAISLGKPGRGGGQKRQLSSVYSVQREASWWLYRAAQLGVVEAQAELGRALRDGRPGLLACQDLGVDASLDAGNLTHAVFWLRRAAEQGDVSAMLDVAHALCTENEGLTPSADTRLEALQWMKKAAEAGNNMAKYELGVMYVHGREEGQLTGPEEVTRGFALLREAGEAGLLRATHELGRCKRDGVGGFPANLTEARFYLHMAAAQGLAEAQADYGELLLRDKKGGFSKNQHDEDVWDGLKWLRSAVTNGNERAISKLRDAEMRVGQPSDSAGGMAHSGRSGQAAGGGDFLAHLDASHPLHAFDGRLRITVVRARNLPSTVVQARPHSAGGGRSKREKKDLKREPAFVSLHFLGVNRSAQVSTAQDARSGVESAESGTGVAGDTYGTMRDQRRDLPWEDGEVEEETWGGQQGYRWMMITRGRTRRGGTTARGAGVDGIDNVWEVPIESSNIATPVRGWKADPEWNQTFSVYLEGAKGSWQQPLLLTLFQVRERTSRYRAAEEIGCNKILPWTIPLGRRRLTWVQLQHEDGSAVVGANGKAAEVLLELSRSRARPPAILLETDEQKEMAAMYKWHTPDRSHTEMALRRQQAREAREIGRTVERDINDVHVDAGEGHYRILSSQQRTRMR
jgi:TPR repeat protein